MATRITWEEETQGLGDGFSVEGGTVVTDFEECTFRAPRPGFFLGDSTATSEDVNSVVHLEQRNRSENIPSCPPSRPFLGKLDRLATELICQILEHLDICSVLAFRRVNQRSMAVVDSFSPFRSIATFPKLLGAVEALQCRSWGIKELVRCVFDEQCSICGYFGDCLYLVTPERWCYRCFLKIPELGIQCIGASQMSREEAIRICGRVPHVPLLVGHYGPYAKELSQRGTGWDRRALQRAVPLASTWRFAYVEPWHPTRYATIIRAPYWDVDAARFEEGFLCRACASQGWTHRAVKPPIIHCGACPIWGLPWRRYTREGIKAHIERHGSIFKIRDSHGETRYVHEKPFEERTWCDVDELREISSLLQGCREKEIVVPQGQPIFQGWDRVSPGYVSVEERGHG